MKARRSKLLPAAVQVAGVHDYPEARLLIAAGVRMIGFPLRLPVHREDLSEAEAAAVIRQFPPEVTPVLITYLPKAREIDALARFLKVSAIQLHGGIAPAELQELRAGHSDFFLVKSLIVRENNLAALREQIETYAPLVDAFITDTFDPETGAEGATGKTHDWKISRKLVESSPRPIILAGGLTPDNVAEAIRTARPAAVDVHTGVEGRDGRKSETLVRRFLENARNGFLDTGRAFR